MRPSSDAVYVPWEYIAGLEPGIRPYAVCAFVRS